MNKIISIEYCTEWGYLERAVALSNNLLSEHQNSLSQLILIPSSGGVFEITLGDDLIFSKKKLDRFPEDNEIESIIKDKLN